MERFNKIFAARILGASPYWKEGESASFEFRDGYKNTWELTITREASLYAPYNFGLRGEEKLFDGRHADYPAMIARRFRIMEDAFLYMVNNFNDNAAIRDRYKNIGQWLYE